MIGYNNHKIGNFRHPIGIGGGVSENIPSSYCYDPL